MYRPELKGRITPMASLAFMKSRQEVTVGGDIVKMAHLPQLDISEEHELPASVAMAVDDGTDSLNVYLLEDMLEELRDSRKPAIGNVIIARGFVGKCPHTRRPYVLAYDCSIEDLSAEIGESQED